MPKWWPIAVLSRRRWRARVRRSRFYFAGFLRLSVPPELPRDGTRRGRWRSNPRPLADPSPLRRWSIAGTSIGRRVVFGNQGDLYMNAMTAARASAGIRSAASRSRAVEPQILVQLPATSFPSDYVNFYPSGEAWEPNVWAALRRPVAQGKSTRLRSEVRRFESWRGTSGAVVVELLASHSGGARHRVSLL
jgi:hypothetical protein